MAAKKIVVAAKQWVGVTVRKALAAGRMWEGCVVS